MSRKKMKPEPSLIDSKPRSILLRCRGMTDDGFVVSGGDAIKVRIYQQRRAVFFWGKGVAFTCHDPKMAAAWELAFRQAREELTRLQAQG